jgi:hypothetical protein
MVAAAALLVVLPQLHTTPTPNSKLTAAIDDEVVVVGGR